MENEKAKRAKRTTKKTIPVEQAPQWRPYTDEELGRRDLLRECNTQELPPSMRSVRPQQVSVLVLIHAGAILAGAILAEGTADALSFGWKDAQ